MVDTFETRRQEAGRESRRKSSEEAVRLLNKLVNPDRPQPDTDPKTRARSSLLWDSVNPYREDEDTDTRTADSAINRQLEGDDELKTFRNEANNRENKTNREKARVVTENFGDDLNTRLNKGEGINIDLIDADKRDKYTDDKDNFTIKKRTYTQNRQTIDTLRADFKTAITDSDRSRINGEISTLTKTNSDLSSEISSLDLRIKRTESDAKKGGMTNIVKDQIDAALKETQSIRSTEKRREIIRQILIRDYMEVKRRGLEDEFRQVFADIADNEGLLTLLVSPDEDDDGRKKDALDSFIQSALPSAPDADEEAIEAFVLDVIDTKGNIADEMRELASDLGISESDPMLKKFRNLYEKNQLLESGGSYPEKMIVLLQSDTISESEKVELALILIQYEGQNYALNTIVIAELTEISRSLPNPPREEIQIKIRSKSEKLKEKFADKLSDQVTSKGFDKNNNLITDYEKQLHLLLDAGVNLDSLDQGMLEERRLVNPKGSR
jgi:hypothetical protein